VTRFTIKKRLEALAALLKEFRREGKEQGARTDRLLKQAEASVRRLERRRLQRR
jgi:hypothetical protein